LKTIDFKYNYWRLVLAEPQISNHNLIILLSW